MKKKFLTLFMTMIIFAFGCSTANASEVSPIASEHFSTYQAIMVQGDGSGQLDIEYSVRATGPMVTTGVSKIEIYKSTGEFVTSIFGGTYNGLLATSTAYHSGVYTYTGTPGTTYYAVVTVYAFKTGLGSDSEIITTNKAVAPY